MQAGAGGWANYVARATVAQPRQLSTYIERAITTKGFAFVKPSACARFTTAVGKSAARGDA